jgi:hypothetical protein
MKKLLLYMLIFWLTLTFGESMLFSKFRTEFQWNTEAFRPYEYYYISQVDPWDKKLDFLKSSALSMGLEVHF